MNSDSSQLATAHGRAMISGADGSAPHACEFCSREPEPIPAPQHKPGDEHEARRGLEPSAALHDTEAISDLWLE